MVFPRERWQNSMKVQSQFSMFIWTSKQVKSVCSSQLILHDYMAFLFLHNSVNLLGFLSKLLKLMLHKTHLT